MKKIRPKFLAELHKIREKLAKEWEGKTSKEVVASIEKRASRIRTRMKELKENKQTRAS